MITGAIEYLNERELNQANSQGVLIQNLAVVLAACNGVKQASAAVEFVNPFGHALRVREAKELISTEAARTTLRLWNEGKLPGWTIEWLNRKLLEAAAS